MAAVVDQLAAVGVTLVILKNLPELAPPVMGGLSIVLFFGYYFVPEALWGITPGKWALGLRVMQVDGSRSRLWQAIVRNLLRPIEASPVFALPAAVLVVFTPRKQRLGDLLAGTVVAEVNPHVVSEFQPAEWTCSQCGESLPSGTPPCPVCGSAGLVRA